MSTPETNRRTSTRATVDVKAQFRREHAAVVIECDFPGCSNPAHGGSQMCLDHLLVRVSACGSWVDDRHAEGGHG